MTSPTGSPHRRILLFAEAVTLAHTARPLCFARGLDRGRYRVAIACARRAAPYVAAAGIEHLEVESIEPGRFLDAIARGKAIYDAATLQRYVDADRALIRRFAPDLVVGDFRLSLSVSARLARVPYVSISSAYWSPHYTPPRWPVPSLPMTRFLPIGFAQAVFSAARPWAFAMHCGPLNHVRKVNALPALPSDLRRVYTDADYVVYSDLPDLFPTDALPATHRFLGPVLWEPAVELPAWWRAVPSDRPSLYVTLGSSGAPEQLPHILEALAPLPASLLVATAGAALPTRLPANVFHAPYLPGLQAARRSRVVVCNGGSLTAYQALASGAPVLGIAGNLDQFLNMQGFERAGVGRMLRGDRIAPAHLRAEIEALLADEACRRAIAVQQANMAASDFVSGAARIVEEIAG